MTPGSMGKLGPDFDDFVRQSTTPLLRAAVLMVGDRTYAEDLVQIALIRTAGRWSSAKQAPHAYVRRVLVNLAKDTWRSRSRRPETPASDSALLEHAARESTENILDRDEVLRALALLPAQQRAVLVFRFLEDRPVAEVAQIMGCPEGTVRSHAHRGLRHLRAALSSTYPELNDPEDTHAER